jgi:hypothetical protein
VLACFFPLFLSVLAAIQEIGFRKGIMAVPGTPGLLQHEQTYLKCDKSKLVLLS